MGQWIYGRASSVSLSTHGQSLLKSSGCIVSDFYEIDKTSSEGRILCTFQAVPIAFYDTPTLNNMVFSRALWENLLANQYLRRTMEDGAHFGESSHADRDEVLLKEAACRVTKFWIGPNNLVLGDVDILDTPNGRTVYSLAKIARVGISSRGFGELRDRPDGLKEVVPDQYSHVCWDMVAFPAVPDASMTLITGDNSLPNVEMANMSTYLRGLIDQAVKRNPYKKSLQRLYSGTGGLQKKSFNVSVQSLNSVLLAQNIRKSYRDLFSAGKRGNVKSGTPGFTRNDIIENLKHWVPVYMKGKMGLDVSWVFSDPISEASGLSMKTVFKVGAFVKEVLFKEDGGGFLSVFIGGSLVFGPIKLERLGQEDYERFFKGLRG